MIPEPSINFIVKDWGINPYDPPQTYDGLRRLTRKELIRMLKAINKTFPLGWSVIPNDGKHAMIHNIMGVVYFHDAQTFADSAAVQAFVETYTRPTRLLNWSDHQLVDMMRKQGKFIAHIDYKKV